MSSIRKEKNYLFFTNNKGNEYKFDINKGIFYSLKDKPLVNTPTDFKSYLKFHSNSNNFVMAFLFDRLCWNNHHLSSLVNEVDMLMMCDKIDSIAQNKIFARHSVNPNIIKLIDKHIKKFAQYVAETETPRIDDFIKKMHLYDFMNKTNLKIDGHFYTEKIIQTVANIANKSSNFNAEQLKLIAYWLASGIYEVFVNRISHWAYSQMFIEFFEWATIIGHTPTKSDFIKQYAMVKKTYLMQKEVYDSKRLTSHLAKHNNIWDFETDELFIKLPQSAEDFKEEADYQNNCVYRSYLEDAIKGITNIIFIRKKEEPNTPYITCEVGNDGRIIQYLAKYNQQPTENEAIGFYGLFKQFLTENWDK